MKKKQTEQFARKFSALGSPQRLEILKALVSAGSAGLTVTDIRDHLEIPLSTLSHHLDKLRNEALVEIRRDQQRVWHRVCVPELTALISFLSVSCVRSSSPKGHRTSL